MDMNRLRYFSVLVQTKHVRRASDVLGLNPASLSRAIKLLEQEVGFKLLTPAGRGIEITDRGMALCRQSRELIAAYDAFVASVGKEELDRSQKLKIGSMEIFTTYFLSQFIRMHLPGQKLRVQYLTPERMEDALSRREIDLGLTYIRLAAENLNYAKVGKFRMEIFGKSSLSSTRFEDLPFAVPIDGVRTAAVNMKLLDGWPDHEFPRQIKYEFELLETALQVASQGLAVVYCPDFVVRLHNRYVAESFRLSPIKPPADFQARDLPIYFVQRKNSEEAAVVRKLAKFVRSLATEQQD